MNALVAGGGGFIGGFVVETLLSNGHRVTVVDNFITGRQENLTTALEHSNFRLINGDVTHLPSLGLDAERFDRIYHLASRASPVRYAKHPIETLMVNAVGTKHLLDLAIRDEARFLLTSTSEVYGEPEVHPQTEDYRGNVNPVGPRSCYDEGKRFAQSLTMNYAWRHGVDVRIARLVNTYGPRVALVDGRIVPNFCMQALNGRPLTVYGDGSQTRSLCYITDPVRGLVALMEADHATREIINIGDPDEHTVLEIAELVIRLTGSASSIAYLPLPADDPSRRRPDISKAQQLLSWNPRFSLQEGLEKAIAYYRHILTPKNSLSMHA